MLAFGCKKRMKLDGREIRREEWENVEEQKRILQHARSLAINLPCAERNIKLSDRNHPPPAPTSSAQPAAEGAFLTIPRRRAGLYGVRKMRVVDIVTIK